MLDEKVRQLTKRLSELLDLHHFAQYGSGEDLLALLKEEPPKARQLIVAAVHAYFEDVSRTATELKHLMCLATQTSDEVFFTELERREERTRALVIDAYNFYRKSLVDMILKKKQLA